MYVNVGFTGTQRSPTAEQQIALAAVLATFFWSFDGAWLLHGDCVGADALAATAAKSIGYKIAAYPPTNESKRAFAPSDVVQPAADYHVRNQAIVDDANLLVACPRHPEQLRSGTWSTVRRARKKGIFIAVIRADGSVVVDAS